MSDIALTAEQQAVVSHGDGHALVVAVAGSGKTTTLVERTARLVAGGISPRDICVLMFNRSTKSAFARKVRERLGNGDLPTVRTYHSMGLWICRALMASGELPGARLIASDAEMAVRARNALRSVLASGSLPPDAVQGFLNYQSVVKARLESPEQVAGRLSIQDTGGLLPAVFVDAFDRFERSALQDQVMTFDDLLYRPVQYLAGRPGRWASFQRWLHLMVDEFQDTNAAQFALLSGLAGGQAWVMAVGDDDQAIYGWRGSDVRFLREAFSKRFAPCKQYPLTTTFRYGHETCLAASSVIDRAPGRVDKMPIAHPSNPDTRIEVIESRGPSDSGLVGALEPLKRENRLHDAAVLVRYYAHSVRYELELAAAGLPVRLDGREPLGRYPIVAALIAGLAMACRHWPADDAEHALWMDAWLKAPGLWISGDLVRSWRQAALQAAMAGPAALANWLRGAAQKVHPPRRQWLLDRANALQTLAREEWRGRPAWETLDAVLKSMGLFKVVEGLPGALPMSSEDKAHLRAIDDFVEGDWTAEAFLEVLARTSVPPAEDGVMIMSMHRAKGLEFDTVFLPCWQTGEFPRPTEDPDEERRLAYVAITRAQRRLVFLVERDLVLNAWHQDLEVEPPRIRRDASPFLYDAQIGVCWRVARALRTGEGGELKALNPGVPEKYLQRIGSLVPLKISPARSSGARALPSPPPANRTGIQVEVAGQGTCILVKQINRDQWLLARLDDGVALQAKQTGNGWVCQEQR